MRKSLIEAFNSRRYPGYKNYERVPLRFEIVRRIIGNEEKKKICDLGCSDGLLGEILFKDGHNVFGVDISEPALQIARLRGIRVFKANLETDRLPFKANTFDVVVISETLDTIYDTDRLVEEIRRILKKNGLFIITTANPFSLGRRLAYLFGIAVFLPADLHGDNTGAVRLFTPKSLAPLLERHKFEIVKIVSTQVNFLKDGWLHSGLLAKIFPTLGSTLIVVSRRTG